MWMAGCSEKKSTFDKNHGLREAIFGSPKGKQRAMSFGRLSHED